MKRVISILLTLALAASMIPQFAASAAGASGELPELPEIILSQMTKDNSDIWWKFDDPVGTTSVNTAVPGATERKSVELHGTFVPGGGAVGGALKLNGTSDFVKVNNDDKPETGNMHWAYSGYTAAFWFKPERFEGKQSLYVHGDPHSETGTAIRLNESALEATAAAQNGKSVNFDPVDISGYLNKWVHVALTFSDGTARLYVNGALKSEKTLTAKIIAPIYSGAAIGRALFKADGFGETADEYFKGMIDDYRLYSIDVTPKIKIQSYANAEDITVSKGTALGSLGLPSELTAQLTKTDSQKIEVAGWSSTPEYDPNVEDTYLFTAAAQLPQTLYADGLPKVRVTVGEYDEELADALIAARGAVEALTFKSNTVKEDIVKAVEDSVVSGDVTASGEGLAFTAPTDTKTGLILGNIVLKKNALERNVAVNAVLPQTGDVSGAISLMSAARKNHYIRDNGGNADIYYDVAGSLRKLSRQTGLADSKGVSFKLIGSDVYLQESNGGLIFGGAVTDAQKQAATFYASEGEKPGWAEVYDGFFEKYASYADKSKFIKADKQTNTLSLGTVDETDTADKLAASFKKTGDNTDVYKNLRGAVYYPSYSYNGPQFFKFYDSAIVERDMKYAQSLGINAFRIWVSYEYWLENGEHFKKAYDDFLSLADKYGIKILVSLFEGCSETNDYNIRAYNKSYSVTSPAPEIYDNPARWGEPKKFIDWFMENYKDDKRHLAIEVYNEPWGSRENLAAELLKYTVARQGSVALSLGTSPSGAGLHSIAYSVEEGADIIQYHDNFPATPSNFETNAQNKLNDAARYNLPLYCTEVQWVGGPSNPYDSHYENLAPTCEKLMKTGKWAPFYWTLMVHPAYLPGNRGVKLTNGIFQEDGSVWSAKSAQAIAPEKTLTLKESRLDPYSQYYYTQTYSDDFADNSGYKWTLGDGFEVSNEQLTGTGTATADLTKFSNFKAEVSASGGVAGLIFRAKDADNGYLAQTGGGKLALYRLDAGKKTLLAETALADTAEARLVSVTANGSKLTASVGETNIDANDSEYSGGLIGLNAESKATFDDLYVDAAALTNPVPATPSNVSAVKTSAGAEIAWSSVSGADSYTVARSETPDGKFIPVAENLKETSFTDKTVTGEKEYYYSVFAVNQNGASIYSQPVKCFKSADKGADIKIADFTAANGLLWYKLDQPANSKAATSSVVYSSSTALSGRFLPESGKNGGAFYFGGSNDYIRMNTDDASSGLLHDGYQKRTIAFYMCPYTLSGKQMLVKTGGDINGAAIRINEGKLEAAVAYGNASSAFTQYILKDIKLGDEYINRWTHVALTFDSGKVAVYLDGKLVSEGKAGAASIGSASRASTLGGCLDVSAFRDFDVDQYFYGMLDDVRIYKTVCAPSAAPQDKPESVLPAGVTLNRKTATVNVGKSILLSAAVTPISAENKSVVWSTSNAKVAAVANGRVTGRKAGTATVTVRTANGKTAACVITVKSNVTKISFKKKVISVKVGKTLKLNSAKYIKATYPSKSYRLKTKYSWYSSNKKYVKINKSTGRLTALKKKKTVTVTVKYGKKKLGSVKIKVK